MDEKNHYEMATVLEMCDHKHDPFEWNNLAGNQDYNKVKQRLSKSLPKSYAPSLGGRNG